MNDLSVDRLGKWIGERVLFQDVSFGLQHGQRAALVARNGAGKTSLMNILAGKDAPDAGTVALRRDVRLGYLEQTPHLDLQHTVLQAVLAADTPQQRAVAAYEAAMERMEAHPEDTRAQTAFQVALGEVDSLNAWDYEAEVRAVLSRLNIHHLDQPVKELSGGQQRRVALAKVLLQRPDILLLDEPTNHLDIDMVEWLEGWLTSRQMTLLLVTHDRYFLEAVCDTIYELADQRLYVHQGTYADFLENQSKRIADATASADKARNLLRTELEWMRRQPKARGTKSQARINAFYELEAKAQGPQQEKQLDLQVQMNRLGSQVMEVAKLSKAFGARKLIDNWTYTFRKGERVGIVGVNGVGKSTLLNLLTRKLEPDTGTIKIGETIVFGYYTQTGLQFTPDQRVIDVVKAIAEVIPVGREQTITAEQFLQRFQFEPKRQYTPVGLLSGGERRRLHLLTILVRQPNFLILDEPTNDLDLPTLQVLEEWLASYSGCLVIVTHDRYFLDRLTDHLLILDGSGIIQDWNGNYTSWRSAQDVKILADKQADKAAQLSPPPPPKAEAKPMAPPAAKRSFQEQKEFQLLEAEIPKLEALLARLTAQLSNPGAGADVSVESQQYAQAQADLDAKTLRWLELAERG